MCQLCTLVTTPFNNSLFGRACKLTVYKESVRGGEIYIYWLVYICLPCRPCRPKPGTIHLFQKGGILPACYQLVQPLLLTGSTKDVQCVIMSFDNACKRSLAVCHKNRASCPVSRLLSVPI